MTTSSSEGQLAAIDGIAALRPALLVLLGNREPPTVLAPDLATRVSRIPAAAWHAVVQEVTEALTPERVVDAQEILISTFNPTCRQQPPGGPGIIALRTHRR